MESGQTGSPFGDPPQYQSSGTYRDPGEQGGGTGYLEPGTRPPFSVSGEERTGWSGEHLVRIGEGELTVWSVSGENRAEPVGSLALPGSLHQLEVSDGFAWVALSEAATIDGDAIPADAPAAETPRLVRIDLSEPASPSRSAQIDLDSSARFWHFERQGDDLFVLEELPSEQEVSCGSSVSAGRRSPPDGMRVSHYQLADGELALQDSRELDTAVPFAYSSRDAFFVATSSEGDLSSPVGLSWVDFSSGQLDGGSIAEVPGPPRRAVRQAQAAFIVDDEVPSRLHSLDLGEEALMGSLALDGEVRHLVPINEDLIVVTYVDAQTSPSVIDVSNLATPQIVAQLPSEAVEFVETSEGWVSVGPTDTGFTKLSLWDFSAPSSPAETGALTLQTPYNPSGWEDYEFELGSEGNFSYEESLLLGSSTASESIPVTEFQSYLAETHFLMGVSIGEAGLEERGTVELSWSSDERALFNDVIYSVGEGIEAVTLTDLSEQDVEVTATPFSLPEPRSELTLGDEIYSLSESEEDGRFIVEREKPSGERETVQLDHRGDELVAWNDHVVAIGLRGPAAECESFEEMGMEAVEVAVTGNYDPCADYRLRGVSVLETEGGLSVMESFPIRSDMDPVGEYSQNADWLGYFSLPGGKLGFAVNHWVRCESQAECDELGVPAYRSEAAGGCSSEQAEAGECDTSTQVSYSGSLRQLRLYALSNAENPSFPLEVEMPGALEWGAHEWPLDLSSITLENGNQIGWSWARPAYGDNGESLTNEAGDPLYGYHLLRVEVAEDGSLAALPAINTPGQPLLWKGDQLVSVEASRDDEGDIETQLHRSVLVEQGAFIEESAQLEGAFSAARRAGGYAYLLVGPEDRCADNVRSQLLPLTVAEDELSLGSALELPGTYGYPFRNPYLVNGELLLEGGPVEGARLLVDLSEPSEPQVSRYTTEEVGGL